MRGLEFALQFAAHSVPIFPVRVYRVGNRWRKEPHITEWAARATTDKAQIEAWWRKWPDAFVGVPLNRINLVIIDCDRHGDGQDGVALLQVIELPPHPMAATMSNGEHHFFRQPAPPIRSAYWLGGEVLGHGRFVVAYALAPFITPAPVLPHDLLDRLPKRSAGNGKNTTTHMRPSIAESLVPTQSVFLRSKYLLREVECAEHTNRNKMLHWVSCRFGNMIGEGKFKSREIAEKLLSQAAKDCGLWHEDGERQCLASIRSGLKTGIEEWRIKGRMCVD